jgi:hypothetical protein
MRTAVWLIILFNLTVLITNSSSVSRRGDIHHHKHADNQGTHIGIGPPVPPLPDVLAALEIWTAQWYDLVA